MAGINPNLGNNLKLQQLQLNSTAKVDTQKAENTEVGDAKPAAVWMNGVAKWRLRKGDIVVGMKDGQTVYYRVGERDGKGGREWELVDRNDLTASDFSNRRGHYNQTHFCQDKY